MTGRLDRRRPLGAAAVASIVIGLLACGGGGQSEQAARFCQQAEDVDLDLNEGIEFGDVGDEDVIDGLEEQTDLAPDEVFDDVDIVREAYTIAVDTRDESVFDESEVQDASERFAVYLDDECGIN